MANISSFEVLGLSFIDSSISEADKTIPREVILNLKGLEEDLQQIKIFISIEKDKMKTLFYIIKANITEMLPLSQTTW